MSSKRFQLGDWTVEPVSGTLVGPDNEKCHLEPKVMQVLACLAGNANTVVTREQLLDVAWQGGTFADEQLTRVISELRRAFHDNAIKPEYIVTVPKRGYRLIQDVHELDDDVGLFNLLVKGYPARFAALFVGLALTYMVVVSFVNNSLQEHAPVDGKSIAVLPFVNMSDDPANEYFSDGITEEILGLLTRVPELKVTGRTSSFAFKGKNEDLRTIGRSLGVKTVLEGSVRRSGDSVRVVAQLINVSDGTHIWSNSYDRTMTEMFAVQDDIASAVLETLEIHLTSPPSRGRPTDNWEAYNLFLKARLAVSRLEWRAAATLLEESVRLDPKFAEGHELLAYSYWYAAYHGVDSVVAREKAYEAASAAIAINPGQIFAQRLHRSMDPQSTSRTPYFDATEWAFRQEPSNPMILDSLVFNYIYAGYAVEALSIARQYVALDPLSLDANLDLFGALVSTDRLNEAMRVLDFIDEIAVRPSNWEWTIAGAKLVSGDDESAIEYFESLLHHYGYSDTDWVRELVVAGRDSIHGQAIFDRRIPEITVSLSEDDDINWSGELVNWYMYFGYADRYLDLIRATDFRDEPWSYIDEHIWVGHAFRRLGFTAQPDYLTLATDRGIVDIWNKHGPPDFCEASGDSWICE